MRRYLSIDNITDYFANLAQENPQFAETFILGKSVLSDETQIGGTTWAELKEVAMIGKNEQQSWFVSIISF